MNELKQTNGMDERDEQKTATKKAGNTKLGSLLPAPHRSCRRGCRNKQRVAVRLPDLAGDCKEAKGDDLSIFRASTWLFSCPL